MAHDLAVELSDEREGVRSSRIARIAVTMSSAGSPPRPPEKASRSTLSAASRSASASIRTTACDSDVDNASVSSRR
jgi:hypothetical protein